MTSLPFRRLENQLIGARLASFLTINGLKALSKSVEAGESATELDVLPDALRLTVAALVVVGFGLRKFDSKDRDLFWASFSFRSLSTLAAFFSAFSFS